MNKSKKSKKQFIINEKRTFDFMKLLEHNLK